MKRAGICLGAAAVFGIGVGACVAQEPAPVATTSTGTWHYPPSSIQADVIRSWGDDAMSRLMKVWETAYRKQHPEINFKDELRGSATGMAGITTNTSDLALMGRPVTVNEVIGFEWVYRAKPLGLRVANGNLRNEGGSPALAAIVSTANPLQTISMKQLAAMLGCHAERASAPTWGMAGAVGPWAQKPLHAYVYDDQTGTGQFLQQALLGGGDCWNWDAVTEFHDVKRADGLLSTAGEQMAGALRHNPAGLALTTLRYAGAGTKALAIEAGGGPITLTPNTVRDGTYPLSRGVHVYLTRLAGKPVDVKVASFLRFVLSPEGQSLVSTQGDFLPLDAKAAAQELRKLE